MARRWASVACGSNSIFFEWAASVPFIVYAPGRYAPSRVSENISLVDLMPTLVDLAAGDAFDDYADPMDGQSLVPALNGDTSGMSDIVIAEFAADGSTGPSRMVRKGPWKLMWLEGGRHPALQYRGRSQRDRQQSR